MTAVVRSWNGPNGEHVVTRRRRGNSAAGPIDDAARELADSASDFFFEKVRQQLPGILAENDAAIRETISASITESLASVDLDTRVAALEARARRGLIKGFVLTAIGGAVGGAVLGVLLGRVFR